MKAVTSLIRMTDEQVNSAARGVMEGPLAGSRYYYLSYLVSLLMEVLMQRQRETDQVYQEILGTINSSLDGEEGEETGQQ